MKPLEVVANMLGIVYMILWSSVWIPQVLTNFKTRKVSGVSSQFLVLNMIGYVYYAIFVWVGSWYQHAHHLPKSIVWQDKFFATAASSIILTMGVQTFILWPHTRSDKFSPLLIMVAYTLLGIGLYNVLLGIGGFMPWFSESRKFNTYSVIHYFGLAKSFCSLVKQVPQVRLNFKRKHTVGHNMMGPTFDLIGGVSSLLQMAINAHLTRAEDGSYNFGYFTSNVPKVFLSLESIFFDSVFLFQAFILYRSNNLRIRAEQRLAHLQEVEDSEDKIVDESYGDSAGGDQDDVEAKKNKNNKKTPGYYPSDPMTQSLDGLGSSEGSLNYPNNKLPHQTEQDGLLPTTNPNYHTSNSTVGQPEGGAYQ